MLTGDVYTVNNGRGDCVSEMNESSLVALLQTRFSAHTILLYGSRARGDATPHSDWDVVCVGNVAKTEHRGWWEEGAFLDVFVYAELPTESLEPDHLGLLGGRILVDERGLAEPFLRKLAEYHARGPAPMPEHHRQMLHTWVTKTVERARRGLQDEADLEAHFRRYWLLKDLLEMSYQLRGRWFPGPKVALTSLKDEDPALWQLFARALAPGADFASLEGLATAVIAV
jgi:predicted nucleotidyltransferase